MRNAAKPLFGLLADQDRRPELKRAIEEGGYDAFRAFIDEWERTLKEAGEDRFGELEEWLGWCRAAFPRPVRFSPVWQAVWDELGERLRWKKYAFEAVPPGEREGEWQILLDNPYAHQGIVCYPGLSFMEAAYLFGYFKPTLTGNEYMRMQKIVNLLEVSGAPPEKRAEKRGNRVDES